MFESQHDAGVEWTKAGTKWVMALVQAPLTDALAHPRKEPFVGRSSSKVNDSCYPAHTRSGLKLDPGNHPPTVIGRC